MNNTKQNIDNFIEKLEQTILTINGKSPYISILIGDFNAKSSSWWGDYDDYQGISLNHLTTSHGFQQLINEPTHLRPNTNPSCIDLIFISEPNLAHNFGVRPSLASQCHHQIIYLSINFEIFFPPPYKRKIWNYNECEYAKIQNALSSVNWNNMFVNKTSNEQVSFLNTCILNAFENFCPSKIITCNDKDAPWMTDNIKHHLKDKTKLYRKYIKNGLKDDDKIRLDEKLNYCRMLIDRAKQSYLSNLGNKLNNPLTGPKKYWKILNVFLNKRKIPLIPPLLHGNNLVIDIIKKATIFNDFFAATCTPIHNLSSLPVFEYKTDQKISEIIISDEEIINIINSLDSSKANGWDDISISMIKICGLSIIKPLKIIFETSLRTGNYPSLWKRSNICPIHKKGEKNLVGNYRPISLLPQFSKIYERILFNSLYSYLTTNKLLTSCQSGFLKGDSCVSQLLSITHEIYANFDKNPPLDTRGVFLDMSKAFDKVWHEGLLFKLKSYGIDGHLFNLLQDYLSNRKQRVNLNGQNSLWADIKSGVPQGSVLGPLLFLIYINDLPDNLKSNVKLFADDTSLFTLIYDAESSTDILNRDLQTLSAWSYQWKILFNPDPTKQAIEVIFSNKKETNHIPFLNFNNSIVTRRLSHKHLGLTLDSRLNFDDHINEKIAIANKGIGIIRKLYRYLPRSSLLNIYRSYVRPNLDYCDIIYHRPINDSLINEYRVGQNISNINVLFNTKLESVQYNAALAITGCIRGTSQEKLYNELGITSLHDRRSSRRLITFYKIINGLLPNYLKAYVPSNRPQVYRLRHQRTFPLVARTNKYDRSFFPHSMKAWESLDVNIKASTTFQIFKSRQSKFFSTTPSQIFNIHDPQGLKLLTRLRLGPSHLRQHKFDWNFGDTLNPFCVCDNRTSETVEHFLLFCPLYTVQRLLLFESMRNLTSIFPLSVKNIILVFLYGDNKCNSVTNNQLIKFVINYIKSTQRFDGPLFV